MGFHSAANVWHAIGSESARGECVTYRRGEDEIRIVAVPGESQHESIQPDGTVLQFKLQDFIVRRSLIDFGSGPTEPVRKDEIVWQKDGTTRTFEVLPEPGFAEQMQSDPHRTSYRIHTKEKPS